MLVAHQLLPVPGPVPNAPSNNSYKAGFASALMLKDLKLAQEARPLAAGATTPLAPPPRNSSACTTPGARAGRISPASSI